MSKQRVIVFIKVSEIVAGCTGFACGLWLTASLSCWIVRFSCLGGQGMFFHSLPIALVEGMGFTILVPISTGVVSWFPLDFARVRHRQFNLFIVFTVVALLMVALNRPI